MNKDTIELFTASTILIGTIVGAGFLGMPQVIAKSGFLIGAGYLVGLFFVMLFLNLLLGEIVLRTKGHHQLTGYAEKYLGENGKRLMFFATVFGVYSALIAYLIGIGNSLSFLFNTFNYAFILEFFVWLILSFFLFSKINSIRKDIGYVSLLVLFLIIIIAFVHFPEINYQNLTYLNWNMNNLFVPFGVILFSYLGFTAMPEVEIYLHNKERLMKMALIIGTLTPFIIYFLFSFIVVGIYGETVNEISTFSLGKIVAFLGILTMTIAYLNLSFALRDMYAFDYKFSKRKCLFFVLAIPILILFILNFVKTNSFVSILSLGGVVSGGITAFLILFMIIEARKIGDRKPEYVLKLNKFILFLIGLVFVLGIIYELLTIFSLV